MTDQVMLPPLWNSFVATGIHNGPVPPAVFMVLACKIHLKISSRATVKKIQKANQGSMNANKESGTSFTSFEKFHTHTHTHPAVPGYFFP